MSNVAKRKIEAERAGYTLRAHFDACRRCRNARGAGPGRLPLMCDCGRALEEQKAKADKRHVYALLSAEFDAGTIGPRRA